MARYGAGTRATGAGSTTLPMAGLVPGANNSVYIVEVGVFNTTTTSFAVALRRITTAGTAGSSVTSVPEDNVDVGTSTATAKDTYTSTGPTITTGNIRFGTCGAAVGAGIIWTFGGKGLIVPKGTGNGVVIIAGTGTPQISDWYIVWDE